MWRGSVVLLLVALAFGAGLIVGRGLGGAEPRESGLPVPVAAPAADSPARAADLIEPPATAARQEPVASSPDRAGIPVPSASASPASPTLTSGSIRVTVVDSRGAPVANATVHKRTEVDPRNPGMAQEDFGFGAKLYTDATGLAVLADVPWGNWRAIAQSDALAPGLSEAVILSPEQPTASARVTLSRGGDVVGSLRDIAGAPAAAIQLSIHPDLRGGGPSPIVIRQVNTEADGSFTFRRLTPGPYQLYTHAKGEDEKRVPEQRIDLTVKDGETTRVEFKDLSATAVQVSGQVLRNGQPLLRANLMVLWGDNTRPYTQRKTVTDAQGRFEITLDEAGEYQFNIFPSEGKGITAFRESIPQVARHEVLLAFGTGSISGRVVGSRGDPARGIDVRAFSRAKPGSSQPSGGGTETTDGDGRFRFAQVPAGSYQIVAQGAPGGANAFEGPDQSEEFVLEPGAEVSDVVVRLKAGGSIAGRVRRSDGTPVPMANLECRPSAMASADATGEFRISGVTPGAVWVRAWSEHESSPWSMVTVVASAESHADVVVAPGTRLLLEVQDAQGPAASALVILSDGNEKTVHVTTVRDGQGRIGPVPPGTYTVTVRRDPRDKDGPKSESTVVITGEPEQTLKLRAP
ncbi:MAG: carboxypeptidase regulatory-like domain-containing protein [Planctomycetota bacterium]|nr:carboxypeptidase regulatory-like domain-containing protein [Planctomycetota bacterium]